MLSRNVATLVVGRLPDPRSFVSGHLSSIRGPTAVSELKEGPQTLDNETAEISGRLENEVKRCGQARGRSVHDERGAAAVEFAIVASLFFMLVFAIIDFGFGFHTWNGTAHAAREGARLAAVDPDPFAIETRVRQAAGFLDQTKLTVDVTCSRSGGGFSSCPTDPALWLEGDFVRVTVDYRYPYFTPLPGFVGLGNDLNLHSQSEVRFEGV